MLLMRQFARTDKLGYINHAIKTQRTIVDITSEGDEMLPGRLNDLTITFMNRFERTGNPNDVNEAIDVQKRCISLTLEGHDDMASNLSNLSIAYTQSFESMGDLGDISDAIVLQERALALLSSDDESIAGNLNNLGMSLICRFEHTADINDVDTAISVQKRAVELAPKDQEELPGMICNVGNSILRRFEQLGELKDLDEAIQFQERAITLLPDDHPHLLIMLSSLAASMLRRFESLGRLDDMDGAIDKQRTVVKLAPDDHAGLPGWLNNLGNCLLARLKRTEIIKDVDEAITVLQRAVFLTPESDAHASWYLINLGNAFLSRYMRFRELEDIDEAISNHRDALRLTPDRHPYLPWLTSCFAVSLSQRFQYSQNDIDIDEAVSMQQRAVHLTPKDHLDLPVRLSTLSLLLHRRSKLISSLEDSNAAISAAERALDLLSEGHPDIPSYLKNHGIMLAGRFDLLGNMADIESAISIQKRAIQLLPSDHAESPSYFTSLADSFLRRFNEMENLEDCREAIFYYRRASLSTIGSPVLRVKSARQWASLCHSKLNHIDALEAYAVAIGLLPQVVWLGETIKNRHMRLQEISDLSNAAAATAFCAGKYQTAVEWLEQGRCIIWNEINQLRTPLDDLQRVKPSLAEEFMHQVNSHRQLVDTRNTFLNEIRGLDGFENFLHPPNYCDLENAIPASGLLIIVNVHQHRCDALSLRPSESPVHTTLNNFSYSKAEALRRELQNCLHSHGFTFQPTSSPLRIWWCTTGPLSFLPIHAAGIYRHEGLGLSVSDFAISSYIPNISILLEKNTNSGSTQDFTGLLAVSQSNTSNLPPIPNACKEVQSIRAQLNTFGMKILCLEDANATIERVGKDMDNFNWVHLACHAIQNVNAPTESAFFLDDGPLELRDIIKKSVPNAQFAFLSACQTSVGAENLSEEAIHLAAGMLAAGYRSVVATMWSISDDHALTISQTFYAELLRNGDETVYLDATAVAEALQRTSKNVRKRLGHSDTALLAWVPYIRLRIKIRNPGTTANCEDEMLKGDLFSEIIPLSFYSDLDHIAYVYTIMEFKTLLRSTSQEITVSLYWFFGALSNVLNCR
ncbi:CHAT domain-containing protein [Crucibulum laeve]|uniref:CHAT domain-containing protein n=1 Tax=Crucibulum laeve TaxID=68775 RepID=A0A5C3LYB1_9AGAR|nr:CHAT domain-containing protein [Crucibulum laeve]